MGRSRRPQLTGVPFHLTARVQGRAALFRGLEGVISRLISEHAKSAGGQLIAYAVMPNHLHLVYAQGSQPLAALMQPLLRRIALRVHACERSEGHVFERRFRAFPCLDPDYLRSAILYVHLNPVRASLCEDIEEYPWTTHADYLSPPAGGLEWRLGPGSAVRLFGPSIGAPMSQVHENYRAFLAWRLRMDATRKALEEGCEPTFPSEPLYQGGDDYWKERFAAGCARGQPEDRVRARVADLRDLALRTVRDHAPDLTLDLLRSGGRSRPLVAVRREFILRAKASGYRNCVIGRFLSVSAVTVSNTRCG